VPLTTRTQHILKHRLPWQITNAQLRYAWGKMKATLGLSDDAAFVLHACRHTRATRLVELRVNLAVIQKWMGHKSIQTTMRYAHVSDDALLAALGDVEHWNQLHLSNAAGENRRGKASPTVVSTHQPYYEDMAARQAKPGVGVAEGEAGVAELVDALDLGSSDENRGGSNPSARTSP
jgi:hypothetical protein